VKLEDSTLVAEGSAPHRWILTTRQLVQAIPGIMHFQESNLVDSDLIELESIKDHIENQTLNFKTGSGELAPGQRHTLDSLAGEVRRLENLAQLVGASFHLQIVGHTDESGTTEVNRRLSQERADTIQADLVSTGIDPRNLSATGVGSREPVSHEITEEGRGLNRRVTFHVSLEKM
jgi:outer membrane protein OmpA-like peptidoglycan-associated protein